MPSMPAWGSDVIIVIEPDDMIEFPSIPSAYYYIHYVIDSTNAIGESDESNNVGMCTNGTLYVQEGGDDDHGDTTQTATAVSFNTNIQGDIGTSDDLDFFRFNATSDRSYTLEITLGTLTDSVLWLYNSSGVELDYDDDGGVGRASKISWNCNQTGTYYAAVGGYGINTGSYSLRITEDGDSGEYTFSTSWSGTGVLDTQYSSIAINRNNTKLFVRVPGSSDGGEVRTFDTSSGNQLSSFSFTGWGGGITVDYYDNVYIGTYSTSTEVATVKKYNNNSLTNSWDLPLNYNPTNNYNQGIALAANNSSSTIIYVKCSDDWHDGIVTKYNSSGTLLDSWVPSDLYTSSVDISFDYTNDILYFLTFNQSRIYMYSGGGSYLDYWDPSFSYPRGIAVSTDGDIAVADLGNDRIQIFSSSGDLIQEILTAGGGVFSTPSDVAFSTDATTLYILDGSKIHVFSK